MGVRGKSPEVMDGICTSKYSPHGYIYIYRQGRGCVLTLSSHPNLIFVVLVSVHCIELDSKALFVATMNPTEGMEKTNSMTAQRPEAVQEHLESLDPVEFARREKALLRKIDYRLMPCLLGMIVLKLVPFHRPGREKV